VQHNKAGKLLVRGSRFEADNKFIDVDQSFDLPTADTIRGRFELGRLTLVMPKNVVTEAVPKEKIVSKGARKETEPKQNEEKHEQSKTDKEKRNENIRQEKTTSNETMQNEATQMEKSTLTEAMASFVKDAKSRITDARHNEPTQDKEKESSAGTDITQNEPHSKPKAKEMPKNKFDNNINKHEEEKKVEKAIEEVKESCSRKVMEVSTEVKSKMEKTKEAMQKMKSKINEIYKETPQELRKKINKTRQGEYGWLNRKYIDGAAVKINRNRSTIAVAVVGLTVGLYISRKLKARSD